MRALLLLALASIGSFQLGCDRPLVVRADPTGSIKLPLSGDASRQGEVLRDLHIGQHRVSKGARVVVHETWLLRREPGSVPPGYRISGLYNPSTRSDGFVLPRGAIDVYFVSALIEDSTVALPIPQDALRVLER